MTSAVETFTQMIEFLLARIAEDEAAARDYIRWDASETDEKPDFSHDASKAPDRVLAECVAKRELIRLAKDDHAHYRHVYAEIPVEVPVHYADNTVRILAAVYEHHDDYDERWRP